MTIATRVPATYKIEQRNKKRVDLLSTALGVDKSALIDEAIELLSKQRKQQLETYLHAAVGDLAAMTPEEEILGRRRRRRPERAPAKH
jgi:hypothetical protein